MPISERFAMSAMETHPARNKEEKDKFLSQKQRVSNVRTLDKTARGDAGAIKIFKTKRHIRSAFYGGDGYALSLFYNYDVWRMRRLRVHMSTATENNAMQRNAA